MRRATWSITLGLVAFPALGQAQTAKDAQMASIEQYLIDDRNAEVALARSAALAAPRSLLVCAPPWVIVFMVPVNEWSDGTSAGAHRSN
jgi:hypothetical protein